MPRERNFVGGRRIAEDSSDCYRKHTRGGFDVGVGTDDNKRASFSIRACRI
jgi:hypothetical protein